MSHDFELGVFDRKDKNESLEDFEEEEDPEEEK